MATELNSTQLLVDSGLVSYYRMEGNSNDSKGSNNGSDTGVTYSSGNGKFGQGVLFDAGSDKITITDAASLDLTTGSICMWIKPTSNIGAGGSSQMILSKTTDSFYFIGATGFLTFGLGVGGDGNDSVSSESNSWTGGTWYHIVITYDNATLKMYVGGTLQTGSQATSGGSLLSASGNLILGNKADNAYPFGGSMDDVALFNRALTQDEVASLYTGSWGGLISLL